MDHNLVNIEYPNNISSQENYNWFMSNREIDPGKGFKWIINQELCRVNEDISLKKYDNFEERNANHREQPFLTGKLLWFNNERGYGVILIDDYDFEIFLHKSNLINEEIAQDLAENDKMRFKVKKRYRNGGYKALDVSLI